MSMREASVPVGSGWRREEVRVKGRGPLAIRPRPAHGASQVAHAVVLVSAQHVQPSRYLTPTLAQPSRTSR